MLRKPPRDSPRSYVKRHPLSSEIRKSVDSLTTIEHAISCERQFHSKASNFLRVPTEHPQETRSCDPVSLLVTAETIERLHRTCKMEAFSVLSDDGNLNDRIFLVEQQMDRNPPSNTQIESQTQSSQNGNVSEQNFQCDLCERKYKSTTALNMHRSRNHGQKNDVQGSIRCKESSCTTLVKTITDLREHLTSTHGLLFKTIQTEFPSTKAFDRWKAQVENAECVCFVMKKSKKTPFEHQRYFYCQKSSLCSSSNKNVNCTAQLLVKENSRCGTISVSGCLTHYGHSMTTRQFIESISKRPRITEGGVAGQEVDMTTVRNQLLAIYELAVTKKKQKSVDKICAALRDLYDCLKDYDEDDETLPGLEETQAWRRTAAREVAEQERQAIAKTTM